MTVTDLLDIALAADGSGHVLVRLRGELDLTSAPALQDVLDDLRDRHQAIVIDLGGLRFMDSSGLRLLLSASADAARDGWDLGLLAGPSAVQRVFTITGTEDRLPFLRRG
jgi:anti-sigma B factor antagonist